ncbi:MAG: tRNA (guanosine(37)-N1)-methyltransferase TrmD [SAR324 cluster bacterium]|nr:tRNA (guanosine(37)-N1)-methyltransferase TrmD [SAR324 cluster bacterium]
MTSIDVLTLFPGLFQPFCSEGLIGRAIREQLLEINAVDLRPHGLGRHRSVDEEPYGGGAGMVLRPEPVFKAVREREALHGKAGRATWKVLLTPQGEPFSQAQARQLAGREEALLLICGRYEGFDERIRTGLADQEISLGDFVALGGETVAMVMIEVIAKLIPGVLGNPESGREESFVDCWLEYPQYTRPPEFEGMHGPEVLLSGNHGAIARWRKAEAKKRTATRRPDLLPRKRA